MGPCAFCRQTVDVPATCPRCRALYHADCWVANEYRCAIYGCEPARAAVPLPPRHPVVLQPAPADGEGGPGWLFFAVILVCGLRFIPSLSNEPSSWTPPPAPPVFAPPPRTHVETLIADADWIAASMLQAPVPADAEMRGAWRRNVGAAVDRLRKAQTLLSPGEVHSRIDPRLAELSDLRARLDD